MSGSRPDPGPQAMPVAQTCSDVALPAMNKYNIKVWNCLRLHWILKKTWVKGSLWWSALWNHGSLCEYQLIHTKSWLLLLEIVFGLIKTAGVKRWVSGLAWHTQPCWCWVFATLCLDCRGQFELCVPVRNYLEWVSGWWVISSWQQKFLRWVLSCQFKWLGWSLWCSCQNWGRTRWNLWGEIEMWLCLSGTFSNYKNQVHVEAFSAMEENLLVLAGMSELSPCSLYPSFCFSTILSFFIFEWRETLCISKRGAQSLFPFPAYEIILWNLFFYPFRINDSVLGWNIWRPCKSEWISKDIRGYFCYGK